MTVAAAVLSHRHIPHATRGIRACHSEEHLKRHGVIVVGVLEQRRDAVERDVSTDADRRPADRCEVADTSHCECVDEIDQLAGMRHMHDLGKEQDLRFDLSSLVSSEYRRWPSTVAATGITRARFSTGA